MEKVSIFIDSGNFYHLVLKKLNKRESDFDFEKFANFLANGREIIKEGKRFYRVLAEPDIKQFFKETLFNIS